VDLKYKLKVDGSLDQYKTHWDLRGFTQHPGVNYDETFNPVIKPSTIRTLLTLAIPMGWPVHQLDVKNVFLHGTLRDGLQLSVRRLC
jgi:hypothetical protein